VCIAEIGKSGTVRDNRQIEVGKGGSHGTEEEELVAVG